MYPDDSDVYTTFMDWQNSSKYEIFELISIGADKVVFNYNGFIVVYDMYHDIAGSYMHIQGIASDLPACDVEGVGEDLMEIWDELNQWFLLGQYAN